MLLYTNVCTYYCKSINNKNNDRYCTAFSIKQYAKIITWQTAAQQATTAVSVLT